jgi:hypothetical protein
LIRAIKSSSSSNSRDFILNFFFLLLLLPNLINFFSSFSAIVAFSQVCDKKKNMKKKMEKNFAQQYTQA